MLSLTHNRIYSERNFTISRPHFTVCGQMPRESGDFIPHAAKLRGASFRPFR